MNLFKITESSFKNCYFCHTKLTIDTQYPIIWVETGKLIAILICQICYEPYEKELKENFTVHGSEIPFIVNLPKRVLQEVLPPKEFLEYAPDHIIIDYAKVKLASQSHIIIEKYSFTSPLMVTNINPQNIPTEIILHTSYAVLMAINIKLMCNQHNSILMMRTINKYNITLRRTYRLIIGEIILPHDNCQYSIYLTLMLRKPSNILTLVLRFQ